MMTKTTVSSALGCVLASLAVGCVGVTNDSGAETVAKSGDTLAGCHESGTRFYVPPANPAAKDQITALKRAHKKQDAALIQSLVDTSHAVWMTGGTPKSVKKDVKKVVERARDEHAVPVLVAYNI